MTARHDFRSNAKAHSFTMAPTYVQAVPMGSPWPARVFWGVMGLLTLAGAASALAMVGGFILLTLTH